MLTSADITFMNESQDELYTLRCRPLTFMYEETQFDAITGVEIGTVETKVSALAVVTEISIRLNDGERGLVSGIEYEQGDIKIDVKIEAIADIADKVTQVEYENRIFELLGSDCKGIGIRNRYEMLGREII